MKLNSYQKILALLIVLVIGNSTLSAQTTGCVYGDCSAGYGKYVWANGDNYTGNWTDVKMHGNGTYLFGSGSKYSGDFEFGKRHGQGTYTWSSGTSYSGFWQNDLQHGEGTEYYTDGTIKSGIWESGTYKGAAGAVTGCIFGNCENGYGIYVWEDGEKYDGEWQNNKRYGQGTNYFSTGARYEGAWKNDLRSGIGTNFGVDGSTKSGLWDADRYVGTGENNYGCISGNCETGFGVYTWEDGERYEGNWADSKRNGQGTNIFASGQKYSGEWKDDHRHGYGIASYSDGSTKAGMWDTDNYLGEEQKSEGCISGNCDTGFGTYITTGGDKYVGTFKDGYYHGEGTYAFADGGTYSGAFNLGSYEGFGTFTFADGRKYVGEFKANGYNGIGTMYYLDGTTKSGLWENSVFIGKKESKTLPAITWISPQYTNSTQIQKDIDVKLCVKSESELSNTQIFVNGILKMNVGTRGYSVVSSTCDYTIEKNIPLEVGTNQIEVKITNAGGTVSSDKRTITVSSPANTTTEKRIALVIGNSAYQTSPLRNPKNDAVTIAAELRKVGFEVMEYTDLSQADMLKNIRAFGNKLAAEKGTGLFYFAGHGLQLNGENYIVPVDAIIEKEQDVELEAVNLKRVLGEMDYAANDLNIVILDACRNNPFVRSFRSGGNNGLATTIAPKGTFIAYATAPGSVASDGTGQNGLYTEELVKAMQQPGKRIEDVFKQVRNGVYEKSGKQQVPWENSSIFGDFYFKQ